MPWLVVSSVAALMALPFDSGRGHVLRPHPSSRVRAPSAAACDSPDRGVRAWTEREEVGMPTHHWRQPVERVSANDATTLATDRGPAPMNIGAVLLVERGGELSVDDVCSLLDARLPRVRRLRQRLMRTPPGCGRPVWVDDPDFA